MIIYVLLAGVGLLLGIAAILFGFGGGFAVVPLVYHVFPAYGLLSAADARYAMRIGVATSTAVMIVGTMYSTLKHHLAGHIDGPSVFPMGRAAALPCRAHSPRDGGQAGGCRAGHCVLHGCLNSVGHRRDVNVARHGRFPSIDPNQSASFAESVAS